MNTSLSPRAFSLVEVAIAVAIFGGSMLVLVALLPSLARQTSESADLLAAQRLAEPLRIELRRLAAAGGLDVLAAAVPVGGAGVRGRAFVGTRDGRVLDDASGSEIPSEEQYFLLELWRFPSGALAHVSGQASLPVWVRVSWPYLPRERGAPASGSARQQLTFATAINP